MYYCKKKDVIMCYNTVLERHEKTEASGILHVKIVRGDENVNFSTVLVFATCCETWKMFKI